MATEVNLPELGENIEAGTVISVLVNVGDDVTADQPLLELETDKAVVEVPSSAAGVVQEIRVKEGDSLPIGGTILVLDANGAAPAETKSKKVEAPAPVEAPVPVEAPASVEETAPAAPIADPDEHPAPEPIKAPKSDAPFPKRSGTVRAAPSVRKLAREIGVDIYAVEPASPGSPIRVEDVKAHARSTRHGSITTEHAGSTAPVGAPLPSFEKWGGVTREKMSTVRRVTAEHMARSWTAPHVTHNDKADITELEKFRKQHAKATEKTGGKLTATAILVKVVAKALQQFPNFNCSLDITNSEIVYKKFYNIGVAVDTPHGLLVPNLKNVNDKSLVDIAAELASMSARARERKSTLEELQGSCITITNLGGIGGSSFTPIVNAPEVAIIGVSRSAVEPVWDGSGFVPRTLMPISLSYDHRVIDGADAARFTRWICAALEQPMLMFLDS